MSPRPPFPPPEPAKSGKQRLIIGILLGIVLLGGVFSFLLSGGKAPRKETKHVDVLTITLPPPPPPPPPPPKIEPPKTEPPPDEKKEEVAEEEPPPEAEPEPSPESPPEEVLGTNVQGNGPGMAGLGTKGNGGGMRNSVGGGASAKQRADWYTKRVLATTVMQALQRDPATKHLVLSSSIRVWVDKDGTILRVSKQGSNSAAIEKVLVGLRTPQPPPAGVSYVDLNISARKPAA